MRVPEVHDMTVVTYVEGPGVEGHHLRVPVQVRVNLQHRHLAGERPFTFGKLHLLHWNITGAGYLKY